MRPIVNKHMDYKELTADLTRAADRPAYILCGEETYLLQQIRQHLLEKLITPGCEPIDRVNIAGDGNARSIDWQRIMAEMKTPPFLSSKKVISLTRTGLFSSSLATDHEAEELEALLTHIPEFCCLVFLEEDVVYNNRLLRRMREAGAVSAKLDRQNMNDLMRWVAGLCSRENLRITREAAESLILRCELSMSDIASELSTVFLFYQFTGKGDILTEDLDFLCREDMTGKIFDLTDAIAERRIDAALRMIDVFHERREPPLFILTMLARQSRDLIVAKDAGEAERIIASGVTKSLFYARKLMRQARRFSMEKLESMLEGCFQADFAIKTGRMDDQDAVTVLVIRACEAG